MSFYLSDSMQNLTVLSLSVTVRAQMLSELEEIMQYKMSNDQPERQESMKRTWMKRSVKVKHDCLRRIADVSVKIERMSTRSRRLATDTPSTFPSFAAGRGQPRVDQIRRSLP